MVHTVQIGVHTLPLLPAVMKCNSLLTTPRTGIVTSLGSSRSDSRDCKRRHDVTVATAKVTLIDAVSSKQY